MGVASSRPWISWFIRCVGRQFKNIAIVSFSLEMGIAFPIS